MRTYIGLIKQLLHGYLQLQRGASVRLQRLRELNSMGDSLTASSFLKPAVIGYNGVYISQWRSVPVKRHVGVDICNFVTVGECDARAKQRQHRGAAAYLDGAAGTEQVPGRRLFWARYLCTRNRGTEVRNRAG